MGQRSSNLGKSLLGRETQVSLVRQACGQCGWGTAKKPGFLELSELGVAWRGGGGSAWTHSVEILSCSLQVHFVEHHGARLGSLEADELSFLSAALQVTSLKGIKSQRH